MQHCAFTLWSVILSFSSVVWLSSYTLSLPEWAAKASITHYFNSKTHLSEEKATPKKLALIIAVSEYAPHTGWTKTSANHDVPLIKTALSKQGFDTTNDLILLQNEQATKGGMLQAFQAITEQAEKGSVVVIHYSGHGQQIMDLNGDELDGYDEALVPYDAPQEVKDNHRDYRGEKHLSDDELDGLTRKLRAKIGPQGNLLFLLDACHSGTATRGAARVRGTHLKIAPKDYHPQIQSSNSDSWDKTGEDPTLSPFIIFSSSGAGELNYEVEDVQGMMVGPLSYAFSRTLSEAGSRATYQGLFDKIKQEMLMLAPYQTPQIEGNASHQLFGGLAVDQPVYFLVENIHTPQQVSINGGELMGLYHGSKLAFYDIDVQDTSLQPPKARATVTESFLSSNTITLDRPLSEESLRNSWIFVEERTFGKMQVSCKLDLNSHTALNQTLLHTFNDIPTISIHENQAELLIRSAGQKIQLLSGAGYILLEENLSQDMDRLHRMIKQKVLDYARGKYLRQMYFSEPSLRLDFKIIPVSASGSEMRKIKSVPHAGTMEGEPLILKNGDHFKLSVSNKGSKKTYFCVLDIQPDNIINVLVPYGRRSPEEFVIEPGETKVLDGIFVIGEPYGKECFKLISTSTPISLIRMVNTRGSSGIPKGAHPLEVLFHSTYTSQGLRGANPVSIPPSSGHVSSIHFTISP